MALVSTTYTYGYASESEPNCYQIDGTLQVRGNVVILDCQAYINHGYVTASVSGFTASVVKRYLVYRIDTEYLLFKIPAQYAPKQTTYFPLKFYYTSLVAANASGPDAMGILKTDGSFYMRPLNCSTNDATTQGGTTIPQGLQVIRDATFDASTNTLTQADHLPSSYVRGIYQIGG